MADVQAVRDEYRTQNWAMVIQQWVIQPGVLQTARDI